MWAICDMLIDKTKEPYVYETNYGAIKKIYSSINNKFQIGDKIKIIDRGQFYSSYKAMAISMKIEEKDWMQHGLKEGNTGYIMDVKTHEDKADIIYAVEIRKKIALVSEEGLEKIEELLPNRLFEI